MASKYESLMFWAAIFSLVLVVVRWISRDVPELFLGAEAAFEVIINLVMGYLVSYIFYLLNVYFPRENKKKQLLKEIATCLGIIHYNIQVFSEHYQTEINKIKESGAMYFLKHELDLLAPPHPYLLFFEYKRLKHCSGGFLADLLVLEEVNRFVVNIALSYAKDAEYEYETELMFFEQIDFSKEMKLAWYAGNLAGFFKNKAYGVENFVSSSLESDFLYAVRACSSIVAKREADSRELMKNLRMVEVDSLDSST